MKRLLFLAAVWLTVAAVAQAPSADKKQLDLLNRAYSSASAAYKKSPSMANKNKFVVATDRFALATMTSEALPPRYRYPMALELYQQVLRVDPRNRAASNNATMIDSVYKGMIANAKAHMGTDPKAKAEYDRLTAVYKRIHRPIP